MKYLITLTVGVCLVAFSMTVMANQAEDEAAIRELMDQLYSVYNKHDEKAMAALWGDTCIQYTRETKGQAAIEDLIAGIFDRHQRSIQTNILEELGFAFLTPDVVLMRQKVEFTNRYNADGSPAPTRRALVAWVIVKKDGKWLLSAALESTTE